MRTVCDWHIWLCPAIVRVLLVQNGAHAGIGVDVAGCGGASEASVAIGCDPAALASVVLKRYTITSAYAGGDGLTKASLCADQQPLKACLLLSEPAEAQESGHRSMTDGDTARVARCGCG